MHLAQTGTERCCSEAHRTTTEAKILLDRLSKALTPGCHVGAEFSLQLLTPRRRKNCHCGSAITISRCSAYTLPGVLAEDQH